MKPLYVSLIILLALPVFAQYQVDVQVVDLQVSVVDSKGNFINDLKPEDFLIWENNIPQQVLDLSLEREPFSVGIMIDSSSSMESAFLDVKRSAMDFIQSLTPRDEFFVMTFDDRIRMVNDFTPASLRSMFAWQEVRYGERTKLFDALVIALEHLQAAHNPRRALFLISDGVNTSGEKSLKEVIELAQRNKVLVYSLILERMQEDFNTLRILSENTGGNYFNSHKDYPRLQAAYNKIASDLAHRFTLYYRSTSDYSRLEKPEIKVQMTNRDWKVRYQKTYYPK